MLTKVTHHMSLSYVTSNIFYKSNASNFFDRKVTYEKNFYKLVANIKNDIYKLVPLSFNL